MTKNEANEFNEFIRERAEKLSSAIASYKENNFQEFLSLKMAIGELEAVLIIFNEDLEWDYSSC